MMTVTPTLWLTIFFQSATTDANNFNNYLALAYIAIWLVALVYLVFLANRVRNAQQELKLMKQLLEEEQHEEAA